jgi:hypothetical protein
MDANGGMFILYNFNSFKIISEGGDFYARMSEARYSWESIAIDSNRRMAIHYLDKIVVFTPH